MSVQKSFGFGTSSNSAKTVTLPIFKPATGFALVEDEPDTCSLINNDSQVDLGEKLTYNCRKIATVASGLDNMHPAQVQTGVQYQIKLDEQLSITDSGSPTFREDLPITAYVTIRHPKNGNITSSDIDAVFARLISACYKTVDGTLKSRFADLMKSALRPTTDGPTA